MLDKSLEQYKNQASYSSSAKSLLNSLRQTKTYLKNSISITPPKKHHRIFERHSLHVSKLPKIIQKLQQNKIKHELQIYQSHKKLNSTFSQYFQSFYARTKDTLKKKKIAKVLKKQAQSEAIQQIFIQRQQIDFTQATLKFTCLLNRCSDSLFPYQRQNPFLFPYEKNIYMIGGYHSPTSLGVSIFHKYDYDNRCWSQIKLSEDYPKISPFYHTIEVYKNYLLFVGGVLYQQRGKKFNTQIIAYNLEKGDWTRFRSGFVLKNHASTIYGNTLMICGGVNEKDKYNDEIHFLILNHSSIPNQGLTISRNISTLSQKICHHKIVNTFDIDFSRRSMLYYDGAISFGGEDQNGQLNNNLLYLRLSYKGSIISDYKSKKWEIINTNDVKPAPRKYHSFNMINRKATAVLAGGVDQKGEQLNDIWMFDIIKLNWTQINTFPSIPESISTFSGHSACTMGTSIYFYNGNVQKKRERAFWMLQSQQSYKPPQKAAYPTKLPSFKSIKSRYELDY